MPKRYLQKYQDVGKLQYDGGHNGLHIFFALGK